MLHRVSIENFYSIRDRQVLDLRIAANAPELPRFRRSAARPDVRLPTVAALFGPNASGKTNVLRALASVKAFLQLSFDQAPDASVPFFQPFASEGWVTADTTISIEADGPWGDASTPTLFRYELRIANVPGRPAAYVRRESLTYAPDGRFRRLFERSDEVIKVAADFAIKPGDSLLSAVRPNASVISTLAKLNHKISFRLWDWVGTLMTNIAGSEKWQSDPTSLLHYYLQNPDVLDRMNRELARVDLGLVRMDILSGARGPFGVFHHSGLAGPIDFPDESHGTRRFVDLFPVLIYVLDRGSVALIDELDSDLHPKLIPELLRWFQDPRSNSRNAQLLLTAHNALLMDDLEKEEIFLTEKDPSGATRLYGAQDVRGLRREPSLVRRYMRGEVGAVPSLG